MDHDWLLRTGVEKVQAEVAVITDRFKFDDELPSGARDNLTQLCQSVWQLAHLVQLKTTSTMAPTAPTLSIYSTHSTAKIDQAPPQTMPVVMPRKTLKIPFDMSSQKQYATMCALTESDMKPRIAIKSVYIKNDALFVDAVFAGLDPSLAARYVKLTDAAECLPVESGPGTQLPSDWLVPHPTESDKFARFRLTGSDSTNFGAKPYCGQLLDVVDKEAKETRAAQLHEPIGDEQGEFDVLPPLRVTIKLKVRGVIKQNSDKRNKLLKRARQMTGLTNEAAWADMSPPLFTLGDKQNYGDGFVECDLDFVAGDEYTCPAISLGLILGQMLDSSRTKSAQLLDTLGANFPGLSTIQTWPGGRIELNGPCDLAKAFKVDREKSLLSVQFDVDESTNFIAFTEELTADYDATEHVLSPVYEGAIVLAHDKRFGDDIFRGLVTCVGERHIEVAHLDYYSNGRVNHGDYRIAPESSEAYKRPPRVIFVEMEMTKKQLEVQLKKEAADDDEDVFITIEMEHQKSNLLYHRGKVIQQEEDESQYVTVDEYEPEHESTKLHEPAEHGDTADLSFWTRDQLNQIETKPLVLTGTVTGVTGPLFIVTVDNHFRTLSTKKLLINPFHEPEYEVDAAMFDDIESMSRVMIAKLTKWRFTIDWTQRAKNAELYTSLVGAAAIVTAETLPECPGHNVNYLQLAIMESVYDNDAAVIAAWKKYGASFGITAFYHTPDDALPHADIKGAVLLGGKLMTEKVHYDTERNMTKFVLVDLTKYKSDKWPWCFEGDESELIVDVYQHSGRFVLFKDSNKIKRGFIDQFSPMTVIRGLDDGLEYVLESDQVFVYSDTCSKSVATFVTHLKYQFNTHGHKLNLAFMLNESGDAEIAYKLIGRDVETGYPIVDLIQITHNNDILRIDEMMENTSANSSLNETAREFDVITEQEAHLYLSKQKQDKEPQQCVDSDVESTIVADEIKPAKSINTHVNMSVREIEMMPSGLFHVLLMPKKSSFKASWAKLHMENMKHYKAIKGGEFLEPIDTETDLSGRDLAHKEGEMWRRCHYIKMSDLGIHCAYVDDRPIRIMNKEELVVPHIDIALNLRVTTIAPFPSVKHTVFDPALGKQLDPLIAAKLGKLLQQHQEKKVAFTIQLDPEHFATGVDAVPGVILVKEVATQETTRLGDYLKTENI